MVIVPAIIFLMLWWICWLFPYQSFRARVPRAVNMVLMIVGIILLLYYGVATLFDYRRCWYPTVRIEQESVLRAGPGLEYPVVGTVRAGDAIRVLRTELGWKQVGAGWMAEKDLQHAAMSSEKEA